MSKKKSRGERKERIRKAYAFDVDKARKLRDESYKDKDNTTATLLRGLITKGKDGYTIPEMLKLSGFKGKINEFPIPPVLFAEGVLKRTAKRNGAVRPRKAKTVKANSSTKTAAPKPKRARKPRRAVTSPASEAAAPTQEAASL